MAQWIGRRNVFLGVACLALCTMSGCGGRSKSKSPARMPAQRVVLTPEQRQKNLESFDHVWNTIRDKHWDPTLGGVDWEAVRIELRPVVEQAKTSAEARSAMSEMINKLGQSHFAMIPASVYRDVDSKARDEPSTTGVSAASAERKADGDGVIGVDLRVIDAKAIVTRVDADLPAAAAGVKPGWEILRIDQRQVDRMIQRVSKQMSESKLLPAILCAAVNARLRGQVGQSVTVTFLNDRNRKVTKVIPIAQPAGTKANFGHLPTMYVTFESRRLLPNIGYIRLSAFFDPVMVMGRFAEAMEQFREVDGIILDLRGNPGGLGIMAMGIGGFVVSEPNQRLGTMQSRAGSINFVLNPRAAAYAGPLAILVDEESMSTSEILAGGLQDLRRARVFGTRTPGAALPSVVERLPNGDGFQYAIANYTSVGGEVLEGRGVTPDQTVPLDRASLLRGHDPVIDAAVQWIESQPKR